MAVLGIRRPEGTALLTRHLIVLSVLAAVTISADAALAQGGFPAPLPGQGAITGVGSPVVSPLTGATPTPAPECLKGFYPLREDAGTKGKMIKAASDRHAAPEEACKVISNYSAAEIRMIKYVEINAARCGIPGQIADQLKAGHRNTEGLLQKVCGIAEQIKARGSAGPSLNELLDSTTSSPDGRPVVSDFGDPAFGRLGRELFR
jgi:hypothetical protein